MQYNNHNKQQKKIDSLDNAECMLNYVSQARQRHITLL